jgi:hypothetical protein
VFWPNDALKIFEKDARDVLKPVVSTLAMLSPMTAMALVLAFNPEIPEYNDPIMVDLLLMRCLTVFLIA